MNQPSAIMVFFLSILLSRSTLGSSVIEFYMATFGLHHGFSSSLQYFADAAEANSWLSDRKPLLTSEDHGKDESSTAALLQRHQWLEKEMAAYASEIRRLSEQARSAAQLTAFTVSIHCHSLHLSACIKII